MVSQSLQPKISLKNLLAFFTDGQSLITCPNLIPSSIIIFSYLNLHCFYSSLRHLIHVPVIILHHCAPCTVFYYRQLCFHNGWGASLLKKELQSHWSTVGTRERGQVFLSRVKGKDKVWQGLAGGKDWEIQCWESGGQSACLRKQVLLVTGAAKRITRKLPSFQLLHFSLTEYKNNLTINKKIKNKKF